MSANLLAEWLHCQLDSSIQVHGWRCYYILITAVTGKSDRTTSWLLNG